MTEQERVRSLVEIRERLVERLLFPRDVSVVGTLRRLSQIEITQDMLATTRLSVLFRQREFVDSLASTEKTFVTAMLEKLREAFRGGRLGTS